MNHIMQMEAISNKLPDKSEVTELPSLPQILLKLVEACYQANVTFEQLSELITKDTALSAKIIAAANSPIYGHPKLLSFERALLVLGLDTIKTIAITAAIHRVFARFSGMGATALKQFWGQSLGCAVMARQLAQLTGYHSPEKAYLVGLLHNSGQLILAMRHPVQYSSMFAGARGEDELILLEQEQFGTNHCRLGAGLVASLNLEPEDADAVLYHHEPVAKLFDAPHLVKIIHLASATIQIPEADASTLAPDDKLFGLTQAMLLETLKQARDQTHGIAQSLGIDVESRHGAATRQNGIQDEAINTRLAETVKNVVLLRSVRPNLTGIASPEPLLGAIRQSAEILFGISAIGFFLYDRHSNCVILKNTSSKNLPATEIRIPYEPGRSLVTDALLNGSPSYFVSNTGSPLPEAIDHGIQQLLQSEGILCLPMISGSNAVGTMVIGISADSMPGLMPRLKPMTMFASESASAIAAHLEQTESVRIAEAETRQLNQLKIRQLAHEANNPLGIIKNYVQILRMKFEQNHPAREDLKIINEEIDRVAGIILRMSDIAKGREDGSEGPANINNIILDLSKVLEDSLLADHRIEVILDLDKELPPLATNRNALKQILINLIKNASEAMPEGGRVSIATQDHVNLDGNEYIEITVADSGPGLPPEILAHLFEPVTSTKGYRHSGLGLSIVSNLVRELGGSINCRSEKKDGTAFRIFLPRKLKD